MWVCPLPTLSERSWRKLSQLLILFSKTGHFAPSNKVLVVLLEDAFAFQNDGCGDTDGGG